MAEYRYRCTMVTVKDYGDGPCAGVNASATLTILPDGSHWSERPATIEIGVPVGTRPGAVYRVVIEEAE